MWVNLGNEYLNLDHVIRMRFSKGWKNGQEEIVAELEGLIKGDVQVFTRYRGPEAQLLRSIMEKQVPMEADLQPCPVTVPVRAPSGPSRSPSPSAASTNTVHEVII